MASTAAILLAALAAVGVVGVASASAGNVILDWNTITLDSMVQLLHETSHTSRMVAMVNMAMWDALTDPDVPPSKDPAKVGPIGQFAACVAAHNMLISFYPDLQSTYDAAIRRSRLLIGIEKRDEPLAIKIGRRSATKMIVSRVDDGSLAFVDYRLSSEIGHWRPVPPKYAVIPTSPQYQMVQPFSGVEGESFLLPHGPPPLVSKEYAVAFNLTKRYGCRHCHSGDEEKSVIAEFWADGDKTTDRPVAHWCRIVVKLAVETGMGLLDSARLLRVLSIALADASVAKALNKYYYDAWRPVTAIRAGVDDNPHIARDPAWEPYMKTENSQEYPSGHGAWAGAAVRVLQVPRPPPPPLASPNSPPPSPSPLHPPPPLSTTRAPASFPPTLLPRIPFLLRFFRPNPTPTRPSSPSPPLSIPSAPSSPPPPFHPSPPYKITVASGGLPGVVRTFHRLSDMAEEVLMARIYGGNHFRFSVEAGRAVGEAAANAAWKACALEAGAGARAARAAAARRAAALEAAAAAAPGVPESRALWSSSGAGSLPAADALEAELERLYAAKPAPGGERPVGKLPQPQPAAKEAEGEGPQRLRGGPAALLGRSAPNQAN
eukprot:tig00000367_g24462.t1